MSCEPAVRVVEPTLTPVTGMIAVVAFAAIVTVAGTLTIPPGLALMFTARPPAGAGPESVTVRFLVSVPLIVSGAGERLKDAVVCTLDDAEPYPGAEALIFEAPTVTPVTCG
jgi:hypothetical protein